jgi:hypothetical protein
LYSFFLAFLSEIQISNLNSKQIFGFYKQFDYRLRFFLYEDPFKNDYFNSFTKLHLRLRFLQQQKLDFLLAKEIAQVFLKKQSLQYTKNLENTFFVHNKFTYREQYFFFYNLGITNTDQFYQYIKLFSLFFILFSKKEDISN